MRFEIIATVYPNEKIISNKYNKFLHITVHVSPAKIPPPKSVLVSHLSNPHTFQRSLYPSSSAEVPHPKCICKTKLVNFFYRWVIEINREIYKSFYLQWRDLKSQHFGSPLQQTENMVGLVTILVP